MPINVTKPSLPDYDEYQSLLREVWDSRILSNGGPLASRLESRFSHVCGVPHVSLTNSATSAIMLALKALGVTGEVIIPSFTFSATAVATLNAGCTPVFADIDSNTLCLDPQAVRKAITDKTVAIMPVHAFGWSCDVDAFEQLSLDTGIPIIYDAAPAFGTTVRGDSVVTFGSASVISLHATKVIHTFEGGALFTKDAKIESKVCALRNFGLQNEITIE